MINIKSLRRLRYYFVVMLFISFTGSAVYSQNLLDSISLAVEKEIGYLNFRRITVDKEIYPLKPLEKQRLKAVFERLTNVAERRNEVAFQLIVVDDAAINAFALPGGYIILNSGMLSYVQNVHELAGVLSHEIAHIDRKHSMKSLFRGAGMALFLKMAVNTSSPERKNLVTKMANLSLTLSQLGFSRQAELEADRHGVNILRLAGYRKEPLLNFWRRVEQESKANNLGIQSIHLLDTHPPLKDRIKTLEGL